MVQCYFPKLRRRFQNSHSSWWHPIIRCFSFYLLQFRSMNIQPILQPFLFMNHFIYIAGIGWVNFYKVGIFFITYRIIPTRSLWIKRICRCIYIYTPIYVPIVFCFYYRWISPQRLQTDTKSRRNIVCCLYRLFKRLFVFIFKRHIF